MPSKASASRPLQARRLVASGHAVRTTDPTATITGRLNLPEFGPTNSLWRLGLGLTTMGMALVAVAAHTKPSLPVPRPGPLGSLPSPLARGQHGYAVGGGMCVGAFGEHVCTLRTELSASRHWLRRPLDIAPRCGLLTGLLTLII